MNTFEKLLEPLREKYVPRDRCLHLRATEMSERCATFDIVNLSIVEVSVETLHWPHRRFTQTVLELCEYYRTGSSRLTYAERCSAL